MKYPALSEVKYDGEYNLIIYQDSGDSVSCQTLNKYGRTRTHFPAIDLIAKECRNEGVKEAVFLAELYTDEGKLGALYDFLGRKEDDGLNIAIWDASRILLSDGHDLTITSTNTLIERREAIMHVLPSHKTMARIVHNREEAGLHFEEVVAQGYEGTVVKPLDGRLIMGPCPWVKLKRKDQTDYRVVVIDPVKERIEVKVPTPNGIYGTCGVKVMNADKATLKLGDMVTIEHQGVLASGSLRHPVYKGKV